MVGNGACANLRSNLLLWHREKRAVLLTHTWILTVGYSQVLTCACVLTLMLALASFHLDTYTWILALAHSHLDTDTWILTVGYLLTYTSHLLTTSHFLYVLSFHIFPRLLVSSSTPLHPQSYIYKLYVYIFCFSRSRATRRPVLSNICKQEQPKN